MERLPVRSRRDRKGRPRASEPIPWPSDDEIWANRRKTFAWWARRLGVCDRTVRQVFNRRGWRRFSNGSGAPGPLWAMRAAPCQECGEIYSVGPDRMDLPRLCLTCRPDTDAIREVSDRPLTYEEEKALALERIRNRKRRELQRVRFQENPDRSTLFDHAEPWRDVDEIGDWGDRALTPWEELDVA